jgi:hypothetical protein
MVAIEYLQYTNTPAWGKRIAPLMGPNYIKALLVVVTSVIVLRFPARVGPMVGCGVLWAALMCRQNILFQRYGWNGYRLGDMVARIEQRAKITGAEFHLTHFPESIAGQYLRKIQQVEVDKQDNRLDILQEILSKRETCFICKVASRNDTLTIHLRLGDCADTAYKNLSVLTTQIRTVHMPIKQVIILGKLDTGGRGSMGDAPTGLKVLEAIELCCKSKGWKTFALTEGRHPDDDFHVLASASNFIPTWGNYSRLAAHLVRESGGIVYVAHTLMENNTRDWFQRYPSLMTPAPVEPWK